MFSCIRCCVARSDYTSFQVTLTSPATWSGRCSDLRCQAGRCRDHSASPTRPSSLRGSRPRTFRLPVGPLSYPRVSTVAFRYPDSGTDRRMRSAAAFGLVRAPIFRLRFVHRRRATERRDRLGALPKNDLSRLSRGPLRARHMMGTELNPKFATSVTTDRPATACYRTYCRMGIGSPKSTYVPQMANLGQ